jgi:hypothetical protein
VDPPPPEEKRLSVSGNKLLYGGKPIKLCGVSRIEALWRTTGEHGSPGWGGYSLPWYEQQLINSGVNYVRHLGTIDSIFLKDHCQRMRDAGIIVEVIAYRAHKASEGVLVNLNDMGDIAKLGNAFFDGNNEFLDAPENVDKAIEVAETLKSSGCIVSGGAWSGCEGLPQSNDFLTKRDYFIDILSHHRDWDAESFKDDIEHGKPVVWSEYFAHKGNLSLQQVKDLMDLAFECGFSGVCYYGFRFDGIPGLEQYDPFPWWDILDYAGRKCAELNA